MSKANIFLFEGYDGSGKTTLIDNFLNHIKSSGKSAVLIGRDFNKGISDITDIIRNKQYEVNATTNILLRLARELERVSALAECLYVYDYIIFDRSILSAVSWIDYYNKDGRNFNHIVSEIIDSIGDATLIYCFVPFETSWYRVNSRKVLSKKEQSGIEINRKLYDVLLSTYESFNFPNIRKIKIPTDNSQEQSFKELLNVTKID